MPVDFLTEAQKRRYGRYPEGVSAVQLARYLEREQTRHAHRAEIRTAYDYEEFAPLWSFRLTRWLYLRAWFGNERPSLLFDHATAWLIEHKMFLPEVLRQVRF